MSRKFMSLVLATAMTITAISAAPARAADPDDVAKFLGAAAALFIIGKAVQSQRDRDDDKPATRAPVTHFQPPQAHGTTRTHTHDTHRGPVVHSHTLPYGYARPHSHPGYSAPKGHTHGHDKQKYSTPTQRKAPVVIGRTVPKKPEPNRFAPLPAQCQLDVRRNGRTFRVFGEACLNRAYSSARPLPTSCRLSVQTRSGLRPAYDSYCMRRNGYTVASR